MSHVLGMGECDCSCHEDGSIHMVACCQRCPHCKRERMTSWHVDSCPKKPVTDDNDDKGLVES